MRPTTCALGFLLLLPTLLPTALASEPMPPPSVWTVHTTVDALVQDNWAVVRVIADIANRGPDPEFPFRVEVPDSAFVSGLTIERDGIVHEATVKGRDEARAEYERQKAAQETGGLVEKRRGSSVYAFLINVAEATNVRATLTYETYLVAEEGVYHLPLEVPVSGFGRDTGADFDVLVRHSDGITALWGEPTADVTVDDGAWRLHHAVAPRGLEDRTILNASYSLPPTDDGGSLAVAVEDGIGYFAHRFRAPADASELPVDLVLVLDVSGSMGGLKIDQMRDAATQVVRVLDEADRLHIAFFSDGASSAWDGLRSADAATRRAAGDEISGLLAAGGTNMEAGIRRGFGAYAALDASAAEGRLPVLVFLTDGRPTAGSVTDREGLRNLAKDANALGARVFALAFGADADWGTVHALARDGGGVALRVAEGEGAEVDLRRFLTTLAAPVLKDVVIAYDEDVTPYDHATDVLFAGSELLVVGTFDPDLEAVSGTVTAQAPDGPRTYRFHEAVDDAARARFLPRLVAYTEIRRLQELVSAEGARDEWVDEATALALEHAFVTDFTSLVVTLEPRGRAAPGVEAQEALVDAPTWGADSGGAWAPSSGPLTSRSSANSAPSSASSPAPNSPQAGVPGPGMLLVAGGALATAMVMRRRRGV